MSEYLDFLQNKAINFKTSGFKVVPADINPYLFDWQAEVVCWACNLGKAALFEECGSGKTLQFCEWARLVLKHTGGYILIVSPLAVARQTIKEGMKIDVKISYIRHQEEAKCPGIYITNYDMLEHFDGSLWNGVVLDESSILKSFTGATKRMILDMFETTPYKLACTATPAPNDHLELGNHAEFLAVMRSNEMIQRFFINDSMSAGNYRLKHHAEKDFWRWITSWAVCLSKPSDLGYPDVCERYTFDMPELIVHSEVVAVDQTRAWADGKLIVDGTISATSMWREKRETTKDRCERARDLVEDDHESTIIWCDSNAEADYLKLLFPNAVEVRGSDSIKEKERKLELFSDGIVSQIITKPEIAGYGLNWQHCHNVIFVGVTYSFEKTYQALRRSWRFGQTEDVQSWMIAAESEGDIVKSLSVKQAAHKNMQKNMNDAMSESGLGITRRLEMQTVIPNADERGENWHLMLGDSCQRVNEIETNSIDFSVYSPPFSNLYIYSDSIADMGNSADDNEFFQHYLYMIKEMHRVTKPGRLSTVHCKDLPLYHNRDGAAGLKDFPGMIIRAHEEAGWTFHSRVTIWKDPVIEMQRTKNHGLLHKNFTQRSEVTRQGMADYLIVFRKWEGVEGTVSESPVKHNRKPGDYVGTKGPTDYDSDRDYSIQVWQRYASPVWFDIHQTRVLNYQLAKEGNDEKHICPLQLDVIDRSIDLWTNPGDLVYDPFNGIGSTGVCALKMGRKYIGSELKVGYYNISVRNLKDAEYATSVPTLFDLSESSLDPTDS